MPLDRIGGMSNAMAIRHAAAYAAFDKEEDVVHASKTAMFTHRESSALQGGEFFARVTYRIIHKGKSAREAIEEVSKESSSFIQTKVKQAIDKVEEAVNPNNALFKEEYADDLAITSMARLWDVGKTEPIKVGKASPTEGTLPGSIFSSSSTKETWQARSSRMRWWVVITPAVPLLSAWFWVRSWGWRQFLRSWARVS